MLRALTLVAALLLAAPVAAECPHLEKRGHATQLVVDGQPLLILGGELGNSSASSREYMRAVWPKLQAMHLNTVLAPVTWDAIEPSEGAFNFGSVDGLSGRWLAGRRLGGDQTHQGRHVRLPPGEVGVQKFRLYRY